MENQTEVQSQTVGEVTFLTTSEFKTQEGISSIEVLRNPKTGKLFLSGDNGKNYRVEQAITKTKPMKFLVPETGELSDACLVNVKPGAELQFSL